MAEQLPVEHRITTPKSPIDFYKYMQDVLEYQHRLYAYDPEEVNADLISQKLSDIAGPVNGQLKRLVQPSSMLIEWEDLKKCTLYQRGYKDDVSRPAVFKETERNAFAVFDYLGVMVVNEVIVMPECSGRFESIRLAHHLLAPTDMLLQPIRHHTAKQDVVLPIEQTGYLEQI